MTRSARRAETDLSKLSGSALSLVAVTLTLSCAQTQPRGTTPAPAPPSIAEVPGGPAGFVDLRVGRYHACAIDDEGSLWCWGQGGPSVTGEETASTPRRVPGVRSAFAFLSDHPCVARVGLPPFCWFEASPWSRPEHQRAGRRLALTRPPCQEGATRLEQCPGRLTCSTADDVLRCQRWSRTRDGSNARGPLQPEQMVELGALPEDALVGVGAEHVCVLDIRTGLVSCVGAGERGQLGDGRFLGRELFEPQWIPRLEGVTSLVAHGDAACALAGGQVRCWGSNRRGLLGPAGARDQAAPVLVEGLSPAREIFVVGDNICAVVEDGTSWCWGGYHFDGPVRPPRQREVTPTTTAPASTVCRLEAGRVICQGSTRPEGASGTEGEPWTAELGDVGTVVDLVRDNSEYWAAVPTEGAVCFDPRVASLPRVRTVALPGIERLARGYDFECGLVRGRVACWGQTEHGVLGFDPASRSTALQAVAFPDQRDDAPLLDPLSLVIHAASRRAAIDLVGPAVCRDLSQWDGLVSFDELRTCRASARPALIVPPPTGHAPRAAWLNLTAYGVGRCG